MTSRAVRLAALFAGGVLAAVTPAHAQDLLDRLLGQPIAGVELQIEGRLETSQPLLALVDIKPGDRFSIETYRRVVDRFTQVPRFETVRVLADERPTGLVLIFNLEPSHPIDRLEFSGPDIGVPEAELQRLVRDQYSGLPAFTRLTEVEDSVRRILNEEGYWSAAVSADVSRFHDPDRSTLNVRIDAGQRTTIKQIRIRGQSPMSRDEILKRLDIVEGGAYRERALAAALAEMRDDLRGRGYYTAVADYQPPIVTGGPVDLDIMVESGPLVKLKVEGDLPGKESDYIPIKRVGSVDQDLLEQSVDDIVRALKADGYWKATASFARSTPSANEQVITFTVNRGKRYYIERVELPAGLHVTQTDVAALPGLKPGAWFSQDAVLRGLFAVKTLYQQDGYHQVKLDPRYQEISGRSANEGGVVVVPNITEGPRAFITRIVFALDERANVTEAELRRVMRLKEQTPPAPYVAGNLILDQQDLPAYYENQGYLNHRVAIRPEFNDAFTEVIIRVDAHEGARVVVGEVVVVGNERAPRDLILKEMTLKIGQPYSERARVESQRRLYNLNGFRTVQVTAQPRLPGETEVRIVVSVVETGSITFGFGGGVEGGTKARHVEGGTVEDRLEFSPRAQIDVGRRNLGGRNRSINLFARVSLKPRNSDDPALDGKGFGFTEYRVSGTFRENGAFHSDTDLLFGVTSEQAVRTSFSFLRRGVNADILRRLPHGVGISGRYSLEVTRLFDETLGDEDRSLIDRLFPQVRLSILSSTIFRDSKNDQIAPTAGGLLSLTVDYGVRRLGSEVGFIKGFAEGSFYRAVVDSKRTVVAARVQVGMARGFERTVANPEGGFQTIADLPASQRFFAGGSTSVRGFQIDRLGVPEILDKNGISDGGNAMMVFNGELRFAVGRLARRVFSVVGFVDAGNVFDRAGDLNLSRLRAATGFGFRYDSPFGPIRTDVGFKLDRLTFASGRERGWEFHLSLGQVF